jgi:hypothetical protein
MAIGFLRPQFEQTPARLVFVMVMSVLLQALHE